MQVSADTVQGATGSVRFGLHRDRILKKLVRFWPKPFSVEIFRFSDETKPPKCSASPVLLYFVGDANQCHQVNPPSKLCLLIVPQEG